MSGFVNRVSASLLGRPLLPPESLAASLGEFSEAAAALRRRGALAPSLLFTSLTDLLELGVLYACLRAFLPAAPFGLGVLLAGYGVGILFSAVAVTPQGLGVVEGAMGATLVSLGLPVAEVALGVLSYRGLSYWLPLVVGTVAARLALRKGEAL